MLMFSFFPTYPAISHNIFIYKHKEKNEVFVCVLKSSKMFVNESGKYI